MRFVDLADCKEGYILAEGVYSQCGAAFVLENTSLTEYIINRLSELGIEKVAIYDEADNRDNAYENTKVSYKESIKHIKHVINELVKEKPLDIGAVNFVTNEVYCGIDEECHLIRALEEEKEFDVYTYTHSLNVAFYGGLIAKWMKYSEYDTKDVIKAGILHDIGKIKVPIDILNKKEKLTEEEFNLIKKHTVLGYDFIKSIECISDEVCKAVLLHHEREDKSGYPFGVGSEHINNYAKIVAIADVYDAMTSERVYKKRATPFEAFEMFQTIGVKNFDPKLLNTFLKNISALYIGSKVLLSTEDIGEIVYIPPHSITEPIIKVGKDYIDLSQTREIRILAMI